MRLAAHWSGLYELTQGLSQTSVFDPDTDSDFDFDGVAVLRGDRRRVLSPLFCLLSEAGRERGGMVGFRYWWGSR